MTLKGVEHSYAYQVNQSDKTSRQRNSISEGYIPGRTNDEEKLELRKRMGGYLDSSQVYESQSTQPLIQIPETGEIDAGTAKKAEVRNLTYGESDNVKINVSEGYTLKAKVDLTRDKVYVEYRNEVGEKQGFEVDISKVNSSTYNVIEQMALESYNKINGDSYSKRQGLENTINAIDNNVPYGEFMGSDGNIHYNGAVLVYDGLSNAICMGDMSNENNVLTIPLSGGGSLKVNRDNLGDLSGIIDMFSPEDVERIMRAIAEDKKAQQAQQELEEDEMGIGKSATEHLDENAENAQQKEAEEQKAKF